MMPQGLFCQGDDRELGHSLLTPGALRHEATVSDIVVRENPIHVNCLGMLEILWIAPGALKT